MFSRDGLLQMIDESINLEKISSNSIPCYVTCTSVIPSVKTVYFPLNNQSPKQIKKILLASSAIPGIFKPVKINDAHYIDGGFLDNIPIQPVYELGCDVIIAILLDRSANISKELYPKTSIYEIVPQHNQGNIFTGTLNFNSIQAKYRMKQGYEDAMNILKNVIAMKNNEYQFNSKSQKIVNDHISFVKQHEQNQSDFQNKIKKISQKIERKY